MGNDILSGMKNQANSVINNAAQYGSALGTAQAVNGVAVGFQNVVNQTLDGFSTTASTGEPSLVDSLLINPAKAAVNGFTSGTAMLGSQVYNNASMGMLPTVTDRLNGAQYAMMGANGQMVGYAGGIGDGSMGSIGASMGLFTRDEAELYNLIQDPLQKQMFLIDKRMKQQSLLCSCLTNIMAAKQDVLKEMGRNLRS